MSITVNVSARQAEVLVSDASTQFVATGPFVLYGDGFKENEKAYLMRLGPSGQYLHATNRDGRIYVSANPNMIYVESSGTYRITKDATTENAFVGYEAQ